MEALAIFALGVAVVAVVLSSWQGLMVEEQLRLARLAEVETRKTLDQIRREMADVRHISNDLATKINERISAILDANVIAASQSQAIEQALSELFEQDAASQAVEAAAAPRPLI